MCKRRKPNEAMKKAFLKPWQQVEKIRCFLSGRDNIYRVTDKYIANEIGISSQQVSNMKSRDSAVFVLYILDWCFKKNIDPKLFLKKEHLC